MSRKTVKLKPIRGNISCKESILQYIPLKGRKEENVTGKPTNNRGKINHSPNQPHYTTRVNDYIEPFITTLQIDEKSNHSNEK